MIILFIACILCSTDFDLWIYYERAFAIGSRSTIISVSKTRRAYLLLVLTLSVAVLLQYQNLNLSCGYMYISLFFVKELCYSSNYELGFLVLATLD